MAVEYRKSSLTTLFEQLPTLIIGYMAQKAKQETDKLQLETRFQQEKDLLNIRLESSEAQNRESYLLDKFDRKHDEINTVKANINKKYPSIDLSLVTTGFPEITENLYESGELDKDAILTDISKLSAYITSLKNIDTEVSREILETQKVYTDPKYAGMTGVMSPKEFEKMKTELLGTDTFLETYPTYPVSWGLMID